MRFPEGASAGTAGLRLLRPRRALDPKPRPIPERPLYPCRTRSAAPPARPNRAGPAGERFDRIACEFTPCFALMTAPDSIEAELAALPSALRARLSAAGFRDDRLVALSHALSDKAALFAKNRLTGEVSPPSDGELLPLPEPGSAEHERLRALGQAAIDRGELAFCVLAGGMATRMGGVVKALVEAFDGKTFLDLRLAENTSAGKKAKAPVPLWLMTSEATDKAIREALAARNAPDHVATLKYGKK